MNTLSYVIRTKTTQTYPLKTVFFDNLVLYRRLKLETTGTTIGEKYEFPLLKLLLAFSASISSILFPTISVEGQFSFVEQDNQFTTSF